MYACLSPTPAYPEHTRHLSASQVHRNPTSPPSSWPGRELRKYHYALKQSSPHPAAYRTLPLRCCRSRLKTVMAHRRSQLLPAENVSDGWYSVVKEQLLKKPPFIYGFWETETETLQPKIFGQPASIVHIVLQHRSERSESVPDAPGYGLAAAPLLFRDLLYRHPFDESAAYPPLLFVRELIQKI